MSGDPVAARASQSLGPPKPLARVVVTLVDGATDVALTVRLGGGLRVTVTVADSPPPGAGVATQTGTVPTDARSEIGIAACNRVVLRTVVGFAAPFQYATENALKLLPVNVSVTGDSAPARNRFGLTEVSVGAGFDAGLSDCNASNTLTRGTVVPTPAGRVSVIGRPVRRNVSRIRLTPAPGTACRSTAQVPVTWGVAIEVPLRTRVPTTGNRRGDRVARREHDRNGATFEKTTPDCPCSTEPTLIADEMHAGDAIAVPVSLPDAMTLATPIDRRLSIAGLYGWSSQGAENVVPPRLMLTDDELSARGATRRPVPGPR